MKKFLLTAASFATVLGASAATPRVPTFNEIDLTQYISNNHAHGNVFTADLDGNDIPEMIVKGRDLGNGWNTEIKYLTSDGFNFTGATSVDYWADFGTSWERIIIPIDYNADGKIDLLAAASWGSRLLTNKGDGTFEQVSNDIFSLPGEIELDNNTELWYTGIVQIADFNNDGYPDILTTKGRPNEDQGQPAIYLNNGGNGSFSEVAESGIQAQRAGTMAIGDINNDGMMDVVVSGWNDTFGNTCTRAYLGKGDGSFSIAKNEKFDISNRGTQKGHIILADFNNDSMLDLFVTGESSTASWAKTSDVYYGNGDGTFSDHPVSLGTGIKCSGIDWSDLNGDGFVDMVFAGESDNNSYTQIAVNQGDNTFAVSDLPIRHRAGAVVCLSDINSDNKADLMVMGYNDEGSKHFQVLTNGLSNRFANTAPTAPTNVTANSENGKVTFTWNDGSDKETPAEGLRYNIYIKTKDGKIMTNVPANPATGYVKQSDISASLTTKKYTVNIPADVIEEWGIQTIDGAKKGSAFQIRKEMGGVDEITTSNTLKIFLTNSNLHLTETAFVDVYSIDGKKVLSHLMAEGENSLNLPSGMYIVKAKSERETIVNKISIR